MKVVNVESARAAVATCWIWFWTNCTVCCTGAAVATVGAVFWRVSMELLATVCKLFSALVAGLRPMSIFWIVTYALMRLKHQFLNRFATAMAGRMPLLTPIQVVRSKTPY